MKLELQTERMIAEIQDGIGWVTFNNPKRLNAVSLEMTEALPTIFDTFEERDDVRVVVMRGAGERAFISGADISEFEKNRSSEETRRIFDDKGKLAAARMEAFTKPIIAMIRGYCIGGGLTTALKADIRIASEDAQFGIPAARLGLGYGYGGLTPLVALVGPAAANELLFSARRFSADEALTMGLVNRVVGSLGGEATNFFMEPGWFRPLYLSSAVWQGVGFGSILYLAKLAGINPELYENATCEGANRWQLAWHITLPQLAPLMVILLIFTTTSIVNVDFEKVLLMQNPGIYETADVIQTYVYRVGLAGGQIGYGSAVGVLNSAVSLIFMVAVNYIGRRTTGHSLW